MEKVCVGFLGVVVLFLLLKPCSLDWGGRGEHCKVAALFWWQTWVQEMAQLKYRPSHPQQPVEGGIDYKGLRT